jgi:hypothetical protein
MRTDSEFVPIENFKRILKFWWLVLLLSIAGGITGFIIHRQKPPVYEATAVFMASIDFNKISTPYTLTQYDEDISLVTVEVVLKQALPSVEAFIKETNLSVATNVLLSQYVIERQNAYWELRFRYSDPVVAQKIVNFWAQLAMVRLQDWQKSGQMPPYIYFTLVQLATLPDHPVYFTTNSMVLSGSLIGLIAGVLVVNLPFLSVKKKG